jgi:hypothetical protein
MQKRIRICLLLRAVGIVSADIVHAQSQSTYAIRFVCGTQASVSGMGAADEPPVQPGNYATTINIGALGQLSLDSPPGGQYFAVACVVQQQLQLRTVRGEKPPLSGDLRPLDSRSADIQKRSWQSNRPVYNRILERHHFDAASHHCRVLVAGLQFPSVRNHQSFIL